MNSPFKFLDAYELKDRAAFFGRDAEIDALYQLVTQNRLTFVYGPSGIGKTSLVQCGLASRFDNVDWLPLFIRRGDDINASLRREIGKALGQDGPYNGDLSTAVDTLYKNYLRPVYLIFDQFEELFILGRDDEIEQERLPFYETIADLLDANQPCRILFIMREDYFGHLNEFEQIVPELYHRKLRVESMSRDNLRAVITGSCKVHGIGFDDLQQSPELVLKNILAEKKAVHMPYVQVYLHMLYQEAAKTSEPPTRFSDAVIDKVGPITDVLGRFLQEQKETIHETLQQEPAYAEAAAGKEDVVAQVLDVFVSAEGTKVPVGYTLTPEGRVNLGGKSAHSLAVLPPPLISAVVLELEKNRILRRSDDTLELAHDTLAALIDQQRSAELRQLRNIRQRIEAGWREHEDSLKSNKVYYFDREQLIRIDPFLPKLALEPEQAEFLEKSRAEAERLENEEKERIARQKADAQRRQRRAMLTSIVAVALILTAGVAVWVAFQQSKNAAEAIEIADQKTLAAEVSDSLAAVKTRAAEVSDSTAREKTTQATVAGQKAQIAQELADLKTKEAKTATDLAEIKKKEAELAALEAVVSLIDAARQDILYLRYDAAFSKMKKAAGLEQVKDSVAFELMEIAFFHHYAGHAAEADEAFTLAAHLLDKPGLSAKKDFRAALAALDRGRDRLLEIRYFPEMVDVKGGTFIPGCEKLGDDLCEKYNKDSLYRATLTDYQIARTETTVWQYNLYSAAMGRDITQRITPADTLYVEDIPSWGYIGDNPVVNVNWYDAVEYANWASEQQGFAPVYIIDKTTSDTANHNSSDNYKWVVSIKKGANGYRLPTDAEWEFAGRGGVKPDAFDYAGSDNLDEVAWNVRNSQSRTHPVGTKKANKLGLSDMSGNVWEWCWDWYDDYPDKPQTNYDGALSGSSRVLRGGSWDYDIDDDYRVAFRYYYDPYFRFNFVGFRVVRH